MSRFTVSMALIPFSLFVFSGCGFTAYAGTGTGTPSQAVAYSSSSYRNTTIVQSAPPVASRPAEGPSRVYAPASPRLVDTRAPAPLPTRPAPRVVTTSPYDTRANVALPAPRTPPRPGRIATEPAPATRAPVPLPAPSGPKMQGGGTPQHRFDRDAKPATKPPAQSARVLARPVVASRVVSAAPQRRVPELRSPPRTLRIAQR
jgi:hypothetical protein